MAIKTKEIDATRICIDDVILFLDWDKLEAELLSVVKVEWYNGDLKITGYQGLSTLRIIYFKPDERITRIADKG